MKCAAAAPQQQWYIVRGGGGKSSDGKLKVGKGLDVKNKRTKCFAKHSMSLIQSEVHYQVQECKSCNTIHPTACQRKIENTSKLT